MRIQILLFSCRTIQNASAALHAETVPQCFAITSIPSLDLGCGKLLISVLYADKALIFVGNSFFISINMFGENFDGKYHSVDDGTSKDITSLTLNLENGLVAVIVASYIIL